MKKYFLLCFFVFQTIFSTGQTLHAIIVGANSDNDKILSEGLTVDLKGINEELNLIKQNTKLDIRIHDFSGPNFNSKNLKTTISGLSCDKDDVIFFYYTGHGFRYSNQTDKWPVLAVGYNIFSIREAYVHGISLNEVISTLQSKNARLTICIVDCCNSDVTYIAPVIQDFKGQVNLSFSIRNPERFKDLYEYSSGTIIASSSGPGQVSKCTRSLGSYFTSSFIEVHKELTSISNNSNWEDLIRKAKERTVRLAENNNFTQTPQFDVNVTGVNRPNIGWDGLITGNNHAFRELPNNFQYDNTYVPTQFVIARIVMYSSNRVFFLMSDNYIVEYASNRGGLILTGYRAFTAMPQMFQWDIVNPIGPYQRIIYGVDYIGRIWRFYNYSGWQNEGIIYY